MRVYLGKFQFQVRANAGLFLWVRYPRASYTSPSKCLLLIQAQVNGTPWFIFFLPSWILLNWMWQLKAHPHPGNFKSIAVCSQLGIFWEYFKLEYGESLGWIVSLTVWVLKYRSSSIFGPIFKEYWQYISISRRNLKESWKLASFHW